MLIKTRNFGEIDVDREKILFFEEGIPGFENVKQFILLDTDDAESPFKWLQSVDSPELAFAVVNPFMILRSYDFEIDDNTVEALEIEKPEDVLVYSIVVVPEDVSKMTMNLKAPVLINSRNRKGMQVVLDTDKYGVRHYILEELQRQEVAVNACSEQKEGRVYNNK